VLSSMLVKGSTLKVPLQVSMNGVERS